MPIKTKLKIFREKTGFKQHEVANKAGITIRQYQRIEKGEQDPRTQTSLKIAKVFGTTVEELFSNI